MFDDLRQFTHVAAHRGAQEMARALGEGNGSVHIIDPNPDHALALARHHTQVGRRAMVSVTRVEDALGQLDPSGPILFAPDSLAAVRALSSEPALTRAHLEGGGLFRGTGLATSRVPLGLQWSLPPGRADLRAQAALFVDTLARITPAASSDRMRTSHTLDERMVALRRQIGEATVRHARSPERVADRALAGSLFVDHHRYPLAIVRERPPTSDLHEAALDLTRGPRLALAFLGERGLDLVVVDVLPSGARHLRLHVPVDAPPPPAPLPVVSTRTAAFTD